ncbi:MAG: MFS transporter [Lonepinella koalarum]|nr:MFS transporter [Lonepinella koalarum]
MSLLKFFYAKPAIPERDYTDKEFKSVRWKSFWAFTIGYAIYYVCRLSFSVAKPALVKEGILTPTELGVIGSAVFITYAVGKFVNSAVSDYSNVTRYLSAGLFISALCNFAMGMNTSGIALTIIWGINGWFQSMGVGACVVALSRWYDEKERGTYYGIWATAHNIGEGITFVATATIVSYFGWRAGFELAGIIGLLGMLAMMKWVKDSPASMGFRPIIKMETNSVELDKKEVLKHQWDVVKNPAIWILAIGCCCMYVARYGVTGWGVFFLENGKGYTTVEAAGIIGINSIIGIFSTMASGWLSDRFLGGNRSLMVVIVSLINTVALACFLFAPAGNHWFTLIAMSVFGFSLGIQLCFFGGLLATDISHKAASGMAMAMMGVFSYAGAALGEFLTGVMIDKTSTVVEGKTIYNFDSLSYFWIGADFLSAVAGVLLMIIVARQAKKSTV